MITRLHRAPRWVMGMVLCMCGLVLEWYRDADFVRCSISLKLLQIKAIHYMKRNWHLLYNAYTDDIMYQCISKLLTCDPECPLNNDLFKWYHYGFIDARNSMLNIEALLMSLRQNPLFRIYIGNHRIRCTVTESDVSAELLHRLKSSIVRTVLSV